ncbi:unnamed protein product [Pleuronectes platessa]|uniref:Uncharacterized protein n=1 Tax=Pleuronectes platessa TaxID=8262 RepID=A0A9N7UHH1_PLEPL|nr:unnamed protein product [Pleuronectes platessa]
MHAALLSWPRVPPPHSPATAPGGAPPSTLPLLSQPTHPRTHNKPRDNNQPPMIPLPHLSLSLPSRSYINPHQHLLGPHHTFPHITPPYLTALRAHHTSSLQHHPAPLFSHHHLPSPSCPPPSPCALPALLLTPLPPLAPFSSVPPLPTHFSHLSPITPALTTPLHFFFPLPTRHLSITAVHQTPHIAGSRPLPSDARCPVLPSGASSPPRHLRGPHVRRPRPCRRPASSGAFCGGALRRPRAAGPNGPRQRPAHEPLLGLICPPPAPFVPLPPLTLAAFPTPAPPLSSPPSPAPPLIPSGPCPTCAASLSSRPHSTSPSTPPTSPHALLYPRPPPSSNPHYTYVYRSTLPMLFRYSCTPLSAPPSSLPSPSFPSPPLLSPVPSSPSFHATPISPLVLALPLSSCCPKLPLPSSVPAPSCRLPLLPLLPCLTLPPPRSAIPRTPPRSVSPPPLIISLSTKHLQVHRFLPG